MAEIEHIKEAFGTALVKLERYRKQQHRLYYIEYVYYVLGLALLIGILLILLSDLSWIYVCLGIGMFLLLLIARGVFIGDPETAYTKMYKDIFLFKLVQRINPSIKPERQDLLFPTFQKSGLLGLAQESRGDNGFRGKLSNGLSFQFLTLSFNRELDTSHRLYFILETTANRGAHLMVSPKGGWVNSSLEVNIGKEKPVVLIKSPTKHTGFNKKYLVYSKERKESETLLKVNLLNRLDQFFENWEHLLEVAIVNNRVYLEVALEPDYFVGELDESVLSDDFVKEIYDEIKSSFNFVEELSTFLEIGEKAEYLNKREEKGSDNATDSAYDHFIDNKE